MRRGAPPALWALPDLQDTLGQALGPAPAAAGDDAHFVFVVALEHHALLVGRTRTPLHVRDPSRLEWTQIFPLARRLQPRRLVAWAALPHASAARAVQFAWWRRLKREGFAATRGDRPSPPATLRPVPGMRADAAHMAAATAALAALHDAPRRPDEHLADALLWLLGGGRLLCRAWSARAEALVEAWPEWSRQDLRFAWQVCDRHRHFLRKHPEGGMDRLPPLPDRRAPLRLEGDVRGRIRVCGEHPLRAELAHAGALRMQDGATRLRLGRLQREQVLRLLRSPDVEVPEPICARLWQVGA